METIRKCKSAGVEGSGFKNLASKTPSGQKDVPKRATYETQLARAEWIVPHPVGATSKPGGELPGKSPQETYIKYSRAGVA